MCTGGSLCLRRKLMDSGHLSWEQRCERTKEVHLLQGLAEHYQGVFIILFEHFKKKHHYVQFYLQAK